MKPVSKSLVSMLYPESNATPCFFCLLSTADEKCCFTRVFRDATYDALLGHYYNRGIQHTCSSDTVQFRFMTTMQEILREMEIILVYFKGFLD